MVIDQDHLQKLNGLMANSYFIEGVAAVEAYRQLKTHISMLQRPFDRFELPAENEAGAWKKAWAIYEKLRNRDLEPPAPEKVAEAVRFQALEREYNQYLVDRGEILELVRRDAINEDAAQWLGLIPGDLNPPVVKSADNDCRGDGRRPDWQDVGYRLERALQRWRDTSPEQKRAIPLIMAGRRADAATKRLERRVEAFEKHIQVNAA
jgi:hypothetical protein